LASPGVGDFHNLFMDGLADSGDFFQILPRFHHGLQILTHISNRPGRIAVRPDPERVLSLNIEDIRNFRKKIGDAFVFQN
jgi:hypothetical protein